ncbi:uncharacterized protein LOC117109738 [Anneissia japonica]|uniref:uncharacterized protein LOC117109738 n=1 Tax=Anneissia japonica TaxID=1529436 RepID=UPI001425BA5F|nr:uncharacterized protein LOC117109738 [Anneissia japonica]XP_033108037.1 uncharacterized protein LOC117109738 [Anneissia japonica]
MGKGERRGRARAGRRHHRNHHHHRRRRHHHRSAVRINMPPAVPGMEKERRVYVLAFMLSILFCVMGFNMTISGIIGSSVLLYVGIPLVILGALSIVWTVNLYKKLKLAAEASRTVPTIPTNTTVVQAGYNPPAVITGVGGPNVITVGPATAEGGISNRTMFTVYGNGQGYALSSSMPDVSAGNATGYFPTASSEHLSAVSGSSGVPYPMHYAVHPHNGVAMPTQFTGSLNQMDPPSYTQYGSQSTAAPMTSPSSPNDTAVEMEPPPPSYEDAVKVQNKETS